MKPLILVLSCIVLSLTACKGPNETNSQSADSQSKNYGETEGEPNAQAIDAEGAAGSGRENEASQAGTSGDTLQNKADVKTSTGVNNPATIKDSKENDTPR
ncbi:MAG: hypothetical protein ACLGH8_14605 [Bacteroidia bacterium]